MIFSMAKVRLPWASVCAVRCPKHAQPQLYCKSNPQLWSPPSPQSNTIPLVRCLRSQQPQQLLHFRSGILWRSHPGAFLEPPAEILIYLHPRVRRGTCGRSRGLQDGTVPVSQPRELMISSDYSRLPSLAVTGARVKKELQSLIIDIFYLETCYRLSLPLQRFQSRCPLCFVIQSGPLQGKIGHRRNKLC